YAGGDFMSGRFLSTPFVLALFLLLSTPGWAAGATIGGLLFASSAVILTAPRWMPGNTYPTASDKILRHHGVTDERAHYFEGYGLKNVLRQGRTSPEGPWVSDTATKARWQSGEPIVFRAVGSRAYYTGPKAIIIDSLGLTDPF